MTELSSGGIRINKFLSAMGYCSRREADRLIEAGKVTVDGVKAGLGTMVEPGMRVTADGQVIGTTAQLSEVRPVLIAVNKPVGVVCSTTDNDRAENVVDMVNYPERIYPIGRLDKDSEGLLLLTNRGELVNDILRAANRHEKEYLVRVDKPLTESFVEGLRRGVHLNELQVTTRPCRVTIEDKFSFRIVLTQGLNRQIRRMCEALSFHVVSLRRIRIMNIRLGNLKSGTWRNVTAEELKVLEAELKKAKREAAGQTAKPESGSAPRRKNDAAARSEKSYRERQKAFFRDKAGKNSPDRGRQASGKRGKGDHKRRG